MAKVPTLKPRIGILDTRRLQTAQSPDSWRAGKTTAERGYGYKWQQARAQFLKANPLCCYCQRDGVVTLATVVDHIVPHRGDDKLFWRRSNWQPLCKRCHDTVKAAEER